MRNKFLLYVTIMLLLAAMTAFIPPAAPSVYTKGNLSDSLGSPSFIRNSIRYSRNYSFIKYDRNFVEWENPAALATFFNKLKNSSHQKVKVLHIGDSHIQADIFTGTTRERLQEIFGYGGRGIVFPYAAAQTHSAYDYRTWRTGDWNHAKNIHNEPELDLGISGVTIQTADPSASFGINFNPGFIRENFTRVKIYCRKSPESFDLAFKYAPDAAPVLVDCNADDGKPYTEVLLPKNSDDFEFSVVKNSDGQKFFECYGILIESNEDAGILYNSVGINGAGLKSILRSRRFASQVKDMQPDLFIVDLGANDFYSGYYNEEELASDLNNIIDMVKTASPNTSVILSCSQDIFRKKRDVAECASYSMLTKHVAFSRQMAHYNYYQISGGRYGMLRWQSHGLSKKDRVHLNNEGYQLKGELLANALLNSYYRFLLSNGKHSLIVNDVMADTSMYRYQSPYIEETPVPGGVPEKEIESLRPVVKEEAAPGMVKKTTRKLVYHKVRRGESLSQIAAKYDATVTEVKKWNRLKRSTVHTGQRLKIYKEQTLYVAASSKGAAAPAKKQQTKQERTKSTRTKTASKYHTVQRGETLYSIARQYSLTVDELRRMNGIRGNSIKAGQRVRVK